MISFKYCFLSHRILRFFSCLLIILLISSFLFFLFPGHIYSEESDSAVRKDLNLIKYFNQSLYPEKNPDISGMAAIIMEYDTGEILWEKNSSRKLYPASVTKMMTAIIALEKIENLDEIIKISWAAAGRNSSFFEFKMGDEISAMDLIKTALICSHNNATIALAEFISGNEKEFVELMNLKAREIGALNTNFQNSNGLDSEYPEHKTTAADLALIAKYCMENESFREIVVKQKDRIKINGEAVNIYNTNALLFFEYIKGIKTGFTNNAGYCIAVYSERQDLKLITIVLNSTADDREADILKLINWANDNYQYQKLIDSLKDYKLLEISKAVNNEKFSYISRIYAPVYPADDFEKLANINDEIKLTDDLKEITGSDSSLIFRREGINLSDDDSVKINENTKMTDNTPDKTNDDSNEYSAGDSLIYIPLTQVDLPSEKFQKAGTLKLEINGEAQSVVDLVIKEKLDSTYIDVLLTKENNDKTRYILIFLISFYFLIFILIIIRNLIRRVHND